MTVITLVMSTWSSLVGKIMHTPLSQGDTAILNDVITLDVSGTGTVTRTGTGTRTIGGNN